MKIEIPAKINLSLSITGKKDNMHTLDMIVSSINLYDEIEFIPDCSNQIKITSNSLLKDFDSKRFNALLYNVIEKIEEIYCKISGTFSITKNIPLGGGLGGSSASIVGILKLIENFYNLTFSNNFLLSLGSDIPYMYYGGTKRIQNLGDKISDLEYKKIYIVILKPFSGVDSGLAYHKYDNLQHFQTLVSCDINQALKNLSNDLTESAISLNNDVKNLYSKLKMSKQNFVMSGSGSSFCILFEKEQNAKEFFESFKYDGYKKLVHTIKI